MGREVRNTLSGPPPPWGAGTGGIPSPPPWGMPQPSHSRLVLRHPHATDPSSHWFARWRQRPLLLPWPCRTPNAAPPSSLGQRSAAAPFLLPGRRRLHIAASFAAYHATDPSSHWSGRWRQRPFSSLAVPHPKRGPPSSLGQRSAAAPLLLLPGCCRFSFQPSHRSKTSDRQGHGRRAVAGGEDRQRCQR